MTGAPPGNPPPATAVDGVTDGLADGVADSVVGSVVGWAAERIERVDRAAVVAVDGPSGAGKSTLATGLAAALGASLVRMDDVYPGWDGLEAAVPLVVGWLLAPLARGEPAGYHRYDWTAERFAEWHPVPGDRPVVLEGVGSGAGPCRPYLRGLIWLDAPEDERFRRAMARDGDAYRPHWARWAAQEAVHFARERTREHAALRLEGETRPGP